MAPAADATSTRNDLVRETPPFHGVVRSKDGDYRWVAEVVSHVVFADPTNAEARELEARALEQLGYQAENGSWRNFFLMGGLELREGAKGTQVSATSPDMLGALSLEQLLAGIASPRRRDARRRGPRLVLNRAIDGERAVTTLNDGHLSMVISRVSGSTATWVRPGGCSRCSTPPTATSRSSSRDRPAGRIGLLRVRCPGGHRVSTRASADREGDR